jgi:hypothetical protein
MNRLKKVSLSAMPLLLIFLGGFVQADEVSKTGEPILIIEEDWVILADQPHRHMSNAHYYYLQFENKLAANETRRSAAMLRAEASHMTGDVKKALFNSVKELSTLANDIEKNNTTIAKINNVYGRASLAMSKYHTALAKSAQEKKQDKQTGHYLQDAASDLKHAAFWLGDEIAEVGAMSVNLVREGAGAGKLIDGSGWAADKVGDAITWLGDETDKLGHKVEGK